MTGLSGGLGGFLQPFWYQAARHVYRLLREEEYRRYWWLVLRYGGTPRYSRRTVSLQGWKLCVPDVASFLSAYREIFVEEIYAFPATSETPAILDGGANIGVGVMYFKKRYPRAAVVAYEPDPALFETLTQNLEANGITGVELHNAALWSADTSLDFSVEGADSGRVNVGQDGNIVRVAAVSLASVLAQRRYEFVKLDIEGAEVEALKGCESLLSCSSFYFVEFHSFLHRGQELGWLIDTFERSGFRVHIHPPLTAKKPYFGIPGVNGMDMQLNLFFWKSARAPV